MLNDRRTATVATYVCMIRNVCCIPSGSLGRIRGRAWTASVADSVAFVKRLLWISLGFEVKIFMVLIN